MAVTTSLHEFLVRHQFIKPSSTGKDLAVIDSSAPTPSDPDKTKQEKKEARAIRMRSSLFLLFLAIACVITWIALFNTGMGITSTKDLTGTHHTSYGKKEVGVLFWFNLAIMAYPAIKVALYRQQVVARLGVIAASIVATMSIGPFSFAALVIYTLTPAFGAGIGYVAGAVALLLHAAAAYMLSLYKGKSTVEADKEVLERHDRIVKAAQEAADATAREENTATALTEQCADELARLQKVTTESQTNLQEAQRRYDDSPLVKDLVAAKAAKAKAEGDVQDLETKITTLEDRIAKTDHPTRQTKMQKELDELIKQQEVVEDTLPDLATAVDERTSKVEASSVARNLKIAQKKYESALSDEEPSKRRYDDAEGKRTSAANANAIKQGVLQSTINERDEAKRKIDEAHKAQKNVVRDVVFYPAILLVIAFACYAGWNAWVQTQVVFMK